MATTTLYPNGAGNHTGLTRNNAATNYQCVNETSQDGDGTYVSKLAASSLDYDVYTIDANSIGAADTINSVTVYIVARVTGTNHGAANKGAPRIRENSTDTTATVTALTVSYATYNNVWTVKPSNGSAFTKTDIDNLQIGVTEDPSSVATGDVRTTQVYVIVDYTPAATNNCLFCAGD